MFSASLNGTSAHKRPFSVMQWLKVELGVSNTYQETKRFDRTKAI